MDEDFRSVFAAYSFTDLFTNLAKLAVSEIAKILSVDAELRKLRRLLVKIQAMVDTVELGYATFPTSILKKPWDVWLEAANRLIYDVDDLLEEMSLEIGLCKGDENAYDKILSNFKVSIPHAISELVKELQELVSEMNNFFMIELVKQQVPKLAVRKQCCDGSSSSVDEALTIGRVDQRKEVLEMLSLNDVSVICITGMGGIGKTTFAQFLFNANEVVNKYDLRIWVSVSAEFDLVKVTRSVIESVTRKRCKLMQLDVLQSTLKALIRGKRLFVVFDDFWTEECEDWDKLYAPFKVGSEDSKAIVTTRSSKVPLVVGAKIYRLPTLSDDNCWEIMRQRPFFNHQLHNLDEVGLLMAKKCKGIPLAAKIFGGLIQYTPDEEWDTILQNNLWDFPQYERSVVPVLLFSYYSLPPHLKKCFAYCSLFPLDHEFEMNELVYLWMAEGLIHPIGKRKLEDIGREYFKDLLCRSFFGISPGNPHPQKKMYKMHVFTHNMAQLVSLAMCHRMKDESSYSLLESVRHLSLCHVNTQSMDLQRFPECKKLRTFLLQCPSGLDLGNQISSLLKKFAILRVLDLSSGGIPELPDLFGCLKYLRYLNLSDNSILYLPSSVGKLSFLQTLVLRNCPLLIDFPENFNNLISLRHLQFDVRNQLNRMPIKFGNLVNLQTLDSFVVKAEEGYDIKELKDMTCLEGSLCITKLENVKDKEAADSASLKLKSGIENLKLEWMTSGDVNVHLEVLTGLQPHEKLKELTIRKYCGYSFPPWLYDKQSCMLKVIHLQNCQVCNTLPSLGELQFLEYLVIEGMSSLEEVNSDFVGLGGSVGFQSLKSLSFVNMPRLTSWQFLGDVQMPQLCDLEFDACPILTILPPLHQLSSLQNLVIAGCGILALLPGFPVSLKSLTIWDSPYLKIRCQVDGADWLKVKTIPVVRIDGVVMPTTPQQA